MSIIIYPHNFFFFLPILSFIAYTSFFITILTVSIYTSIRTFSSQVSIILSILPILIIIAHASFIITILTATHDLEWPFCLEYCYKNINALEFDKCVSHSMHHIYLLTHATERRVFFFFYWFKSKNYILRQCQLQNFPWRHVKIEINVLVGLFNRSLN